MTLQNINIMDVPFVNVTMDTFINHINDHHLIPNKKGFVITANPEIVMHAREHADFMTLVQQADYVTADGIGIVKAAGILGTPLPERVSGYDIMLRLLQLANENKYSVYLLGAKEEVLQLAKAKIKENYPNAYLAGAHNGYFDWENNSIAEEVERLQPDLIFVALGMPRQEKWISENIPKFQKGVFMGVGGSFDVLAGTVQRAPEMWQKLNIEWLYRLMKQPSRAGRMMALPRFMLKILLQKAKGRS